MRRAGLLGVCCLWSIAMTLSGISIYESSAYAEDGKASTTIVGTVHNQDLRRVAQAVIEVKDQEGLLVASGVSDEAGEFTLSVPCSIPIVVSMLSWR
jgi:GTP-sensing pleiotropic transcriptional regulator CodY